MDQLTRPPPVRRLTALVGTVAAVALVGAFFLPLWHVDKKQADRLADALTEEVRKQPGPADPILADFVAVFEAVGDTGVVDAIDLLHYARTATHVRERLRDDQKSRDEQASGPLSRRIDETPSRFFDRVLTLLVLLVGGVPIGAAVLVLYFVANRLRRARSPGLILAFVVGTAGLLIPVGYRYAGAQLASVAGAESGLHLQALASAALVLTAIFGVSSRNWWRVYAGAIITTGALVALAWAYCQFGGTT